MFKCNDHHTIENIPALIPTKQVHLAVLCSKILNLPLLDWLLAWVQALPAPPHCQATSNLTLSHLDDFTKPMNCVTTITPTACKPINLDAINHNIMK